MSPSRDAALLTLVQWLSPAFPVGGFAHSHGLEAAVAAGEVTDAASLSDWLADVLVHGGGRADAALLAAALAPPVDLAALTALARALAPSRERLIETEAQGAAFARTVAALTGRPQAPAPLPVAVGSAAAVLGLPPVQVVSLYLQAFAGNLVLVGVRFVPLGQTEGQRVLAGLQGVILAVATEAAERGLAALGGAAVGADLAAMRHETLETRIFRT